MAYQGIAGTTDISTVHPLSYDSTPHVGDVSPRDERTGRQHPGSRRHRQSRQPHLHRPVHGQHAGRRLRCRLQQEPVPGADEGALGLRGLADRRAARRIIGGDKSGVQSSLLRAPGFPRASSSTSRTTTCTCCSMRITPTSRSCRRSSASSTAPSGRIRRRRSRIQAESIERSRPVGHVQQRAVHGHRELQQRSRREDRFASASTRDFKLNDNWSLNADLSYSKVERDDLRLESTAGLGKVGDADLPDRHGRHSRSPPAPTAAPI